MLDIFFLRRGAGEGATHTDVKMTIFKKREENRESSPHFYRMEGIHDTALPDSIIGFLQVEKYQQNAAAKKRFTNSGSQSEKGVQRGVRTVKTVLGSRKGFGVPLEIAGRRIFANSLLGRRPGRVRPVARLRTDPGEAMGTCLEGSSLEGVACAAVRAPWGVPPDTTRPST